MAEIDITVYGTDWCGDCKLSKQFLGEQRIQYSWINVEENPEALAFIEKVQNGAHSVPMIVLPGERILIEPSNADLAAALGLPTRARHDFYDVIIVGGGPAGLTAALYTAREGLSTLVIDKAGMGGQAAVTARLDNFPGFPDGLSGAEFAERLIRQVRNFDVETVSAQTVRSIRQEGLYHVVETEDGSEYSTRAVLIASGSRYKRLGIPGEERLIGSSVHYCATCDGPFYKGQPVAVIGGGNSAVEEGIFLTRFASHVTMLVRGDQLRASKVAIQKAQDLKELDIQFNTEVVELEGNGKLKSMEVRDRQTGNVRRLDPPPQGVFVFIGLEPNTAFVSDAVRRDDLGFIITDSTLATTLPGIFAAGDVRSGATKQAASAAGEGATAALSIRDYLHKVG
jgi:thioredoxin reductase (NADPH)